MKVKTIKWWCAIGSTLIVLGCNKGGDSASEEEDTAKVGDVDVSDNPMGTLALSTSLSPDIPKSITATGDGVAAASLVDVKKSREACEVRQRIKEAKMNQEQMAMTLCMIESQKGIKPGGKYKLTFDFSGAGGGGEGGGPGGEMPGGEMPGGEMPGGETAGGETAGGETAGGPPGGAGAPPGGGGGAPPELPLTQGAPTTLSIFLDNSDPEKLKFFLCDDGTLTQKIVLDNAKEGASKGRYKAKFEFGGSSVAMQGSFDNGVTNPGRQVSISQTAFSLDMGGTSMNMKSNMLLDLSETGVSVVKVATENSESGDFASSNKEIGAALIGPEYGSLVFQRTHDGSDSFFGGGGPDGGLPPGEPGDDLGPPPEMALTAETVETARAFFDNKGQKLKKEDSDKFADGGELNVTKDHFLKLLPADFTVEFEAGDWDCSGTEDLAMDMEAPGLDACTDNFASPFSEETCDAGGFEVGIAEEDFDSFVDARDDLDDFSGDGFNPDDEFGAPGAGVCPAGLVECATGGCVADLAECTE
jgi:hypothetical protein